MVILIIFIQNFQSKGDKKMKEIITQIITDYLPVIFTGILTVLVGFIRTKYNKLADTDIKKSVIADTVKYIEQIYKDIHGDEKLDKAEEKAKSLLEEKGIKISNNELVTLIESAVRDMNTSELSNLIEEIKAKK